MKIDTRASGEAPALEEWDDDEEELYIPDDDEADDEDDGEEDDFEFELKDIES